MISTAAVEEWAALEVALESAGAVPCRVSPVPDAWWSKVPELVELARAACGYCPARAACLAYAVAAREPEGMWGGRTADER